MRCTCGCNYPVHSAIGFVSSCEFLNGSSWELVSGCGEGILNRVSSFSFYRPEPVKLTNERVPRHSRLVQAELIFFYFSAMDWDRSHPLFLNV